MSPFDKESIQEAKTLTLLEAKEASPNYTLFMDAAKKATNMSERSIKKLIYNKEKDE